MLLYEYINEEVLKHDIASELINVQRHPTLPLDIYTYSRKAVLDQIWDEATIKCRGLIVNRLTKEVIARPFQKFFNINDASRPETLLENLPEDYPAITEKLDGSLGLMWRYGIHWGVASKGSFTSDHAKWATKWLEDHIEKHGPLVWPEGFTPVFEMLCETSIQHHVVHYGYEDLVLLTLIDNETGEESFFDKEYALKNNLTMVANPIINLATAMTDRENAEGYVATWHRNGEPLRVKIKHPTFLKYQRILHKASPKAVLELLKMGDQDTINNWVTSAPKHIASVIDQWQGMFKNTYEHIRGSAACIMTDALKTCTTRKEFANFFLQDANKFFAAVLFAMLDEHDHKFLIWKSIERSLETDKVFNSSFNRIEIGD